MKSMIFFFFKGSIVFKCLRKYFQLKLIKHYKLLKMSLFCRLKLFNQLRTIPAHLSKLKSSVNKYPSLALMPTLYSAPKKSLSLPAYSFCTRKQPDDLEESDQLTEKSESRFKSVQDFILFYVEKKQHYNLQEKASMLSEARGVLSNKLKYKQHQMLESEIKQILQELNEELSQISLFGLSIGPQTLAKKNIFAVISICCYTQIRNIFKKNKVLLQLIRSQELSKLLLQNYSIFNLKDRITLINFYQIFYENKSEYLEEVKNKIIQSEKMIDFNNSSCADIIDYIYGTLMFTKKYFKKELIFSKQTMQNQITKIMSQKHEISLKYMQKLISSLLSYPKVISINKKDLIEYYYINEKILDKNISSHDMIAFMVFVRFITSKINVRKNNINQLDVQIRNIAIKYLEFCVENLKLKNQRNIQADHNLLFIIYSTQHYKPELMKFFDDALFRNLHNVDYVTLAANISIRYQIYKSISYEQNANALQIFVKQNLTYKNFIQKLFAHLHNENILRPNQIINLIQQVNKRGQMKSKIIAKIIKDVKRVIQKQGDKYQVENMKKIQKLIGEF